MVKYHTSPFFFWTLGQNLNEFSKNFQRGGKYRTFWIMFAFLHNFHIFHNFAHFAYLHIFELHTIFVFFTTLHNVAYFAPVSICSTSTSSIVWSLFLKLFKPLALCQQLMFYICINRDNIMKSWIEFQRQYFQILSLSNSPSFNIHFDKEMKGSHLPVLKKTRKSDEDIFEPRYNKVNEIWDVELQGGPNNIKNN